MKLFSFSTQLSMKFILLINVKMPTIVGILTFEPRHEKTKVLVSDLVRHKPGYTVTEDGLRLEISDLERRGIGLSM